MSSLRDAKRSMQNFDSSQFFETGKDAEDE
jgi:hypothetical protein